MNNCTLLQNNNSIVRCKDCHWCIKGTYKGQDTPRYLCSRIIDHHAFLLVKENDYCSEGCLEHTEDGDGITNFDILENDPNVIRCKDCYYWGKKEDGRCLKLQVFVLGLDKYMDEHDFCCDAWNGKGEE